MAANALAGLFRLCDASSVASARPRNEARPAKRIDLSPSLWIGVGFYLLFGRMGLDFLTTGNRHLGPIQLGDANTVRPHGGSSYLAGGFYALFFGAATVGVIIYTGFWRQWLFWKAVPARTGLEAVLATFFAFVALTELFAAPTTLLLAHHSLGATHPVVPLDHLYAKTEEQYVWHFADAIPALDIPETLKWTVPYEFKNAAGGALVLLYKILVIVPVVNLAVDLMKRVQRSRSAEETSVRDAAWTSPDVGGHADPRRTGLTSESSDARDNDRRPPVVKGIPANDPEALPPAR